MCPGFSYISLLKAETAEQKGGQTTAGDCEAEVSGTPPRRTFYVQERCEHQIFETSFQCPFELFFFLFTELQKVYSH